MKTRTCVLRFLLCVLAAGSPLSAALAADTPPGAIVGVVSNSAKQPVARATVTARRPDGSGIRATVSGSDGVYSFADLPAGAWAITLHVDGYPDVAVPPLQVVASEATRRDIVVSAPVAAAAAATPAPAAVTGASAAPTVMRASSTTEAPAVAHISMWDRLAQMVEYIPPSQLAAIHMAQASTATSSVAGPAKVPMVPEALQAPDAVEGVDNFTPFANEDMTWANGTPRNKAPVFDTKFFTPDIRFDVHYMDDFNDPKDHTIVGATESFRSGEFQLEQVSFGGDFHWENVHARFLSMDGLFATTTPRNDASAGVGQWDLSDAYRYLSEANAGYHFNVNHGLNVDAGIFVSYIGLFSYYNFDNWTYQPSYVSSNTPWFFNGVRIQWFPTNTLKIEPWIINGWQSYARFNGHLGYGGQILWIPHEWLRFVFNNYGVGNDNLGLPETTRIHTDDSVEVRYYNAPDAARVSKMAFSFTADAGCQYGGGIHCTGGPNQSSFLGWMLYNRIWFDRDRFAVTVGGGAMNNPGRYLTLLPPINGATAVTGSPYFTENPGQHAYMWDSTINFQYMPKDWITWWAEAGFRHSDVPYFAGQGGVTPPGGNNGSPQYFTCNSGATAGTADATAAVNACSNQGGVWYPDLRKREAKLSVGLLVKF